MAHTLEEQHYLLTRERIRDGELPFLKSAFENDDWLKIYNSNETYLLMACYYRQRSVIEYLVTKASENLEKEGVKEWLKVVSPNENTPLHNYLCFSAIAYRRKPRHEGLPILTSIIQKLAKIGFDVNQGNSYGETPLFLAAHSNDLLSVETLIELGADVNAQCCVLQETVLHQACLSSHNEMLETLLAVPDIDVNAMNMHGWTPLQLACQRGDTVKVKRLLKFGADVSIKSNRGDTAIFFSLQKLCENAEDSCFVILYEYIQETLTPDKVEKYLLHVNNRGESLLDCAVKHQNYIALKVLLEMKDVLFDIQQKDSQGRSLLHMSVIHAPNKYILEYLIEHGLSPNEIDSSGNTPLMYFFKQVRVMPHMPVSSPAHTPNVNV